MLVWTSLGNAVNRYLHIYSEDKLVVLDQINWIIL